MKQTLPKHLQLSKKDKEKINQGLEEMFKSFGIGVIIGSILVLIVFLIFK